MAKDPDTSSVSGIRTLKTDAAHEHEGVKFDSAKLTTPSTAMHVPEPDHSPHVNAQGKQMFDVERAFNESAVQIGTIVTDKKKSRGTFGQLIKSAFAEWWTMTQKNVQNKSAQVDFLKPKAVPKIETAETRTTIIQEAAKYARQAPRDDHAIVIEKIRTFAHDAEKATGKPFTFKTPSAAPKNPTFAVTEKVEMKPQKGPSSPVKQEPPLKEERVPDKLVQTARPSLATYASTEAVSRVPHEPTPAFSVSPMAKRLAEQQRKEPPKKESGGWSHFVSSTPESVPAPTTPQTKQPEQVLHTKKVETLPRSIAPIVPHDKVPEKKLEREAVSIQVPDLVPPIPSPVVPPTPVPPQKPISQPVVSSPAPQPKKPSPQRTPVTQLSHGLRNILWTSGIVIGAGLGIFAAFMLSQNIMSSQPPQEIVTVTVPSYLQSDTEVSVPLSPSRTELLTTIKDVVQQATTPVTHIYPLTTLGAPATTEEIMTSLSFRADGSFIRSLSEYSMFGAVLTNERAPYLVLESSNFDVAFAGMLKWERDMSGDLSPLFGTPVLRTLPPNRGTTTSANPRFVDALTSNQPIRILYDENGRERIVYAFVNKNLILITTSTDALSVLIERIK